MGRTDRFNVRLEPAERDMLAQLAATLGIGESGVVRMLVREAYAARYGDKKPKRRRTPPHK